MHSNALIWAAQRRDRDIFAKLDLLRQREDHIRLHGGTIFDLAKVLSEIKSLAITAQVHGVMDRGEMVDIEIRRRDADERRAWLAFSGVNEVGTEVAYSDDALEVLTLRWPGLMVRDAGDMCLVSWKVLDRAKFVEQFGNGDAYTVAKTKAWNHVYAVAGAGGES